MSTTYTTYSINGIPLDDPQGRWALESTTKPPGASPTNINLTALPNTHGSLVTNPITQAEGKLFISIALFGNTPADLRINYSTLARALAAWDRKRLVRIEHSDGVVTMVTEGIVSSDLQPMMLGDTAMVLPVTFVMPSPFWEESTNAGVVNVSGGGTHTLQFLTGGTAPVEPEIKVTGTQPVTRVVVKCENTGYEGVWEGNARSLYWKGWEMASQAGAAPNDALSFGVEDPPVLYPNLAGEYRTRVSVFGGGTATVFLYGKRRWM